VNLAEIEENDFSLNIPRYVETYDPEEEIKLEQAAKCLDECLEAEQKHLQKVNELLRTITEAQ
jgi:type I restriction enzyme M protein